MGRCTYCGEAIWTLDDLSEIVISYSEDTPGADVWCNTKHYELWILEQLES